MQPIWGFIFFFVVCLLSAIIAYKRGNSGTLHFLISAALGFGFTYVTVKATGGSSSFEAGLGGFVGGLVGVLFAALRSSDSGQAEKNGVSANHKKCQFCAEVVKIEASKCKHCGSDLTQKTT